MKAHNIEVFARDGDVVVRQEAPYSDDSTDDGCDIVLLTPQQAAAVCRWIMAAAREIRAKGDRSQ
ncbi:hypothetical protein ABL840_04940 [Variovorax sp. NFACC27]|uniref:hypothetical protein n=1 Tax=unclassified Variovorax TaxID=663243 RepID=UPI00089D2683|nr:hypothetical protein SAMN03159371_00122 [Variovorax sp. NFACC28]SEF72349.1 hypothetical protein SAMN03159365_00695 [Variovorax sp. NFACC29]SFB77170.1 hypothetical protein SAMN03159379_00694 [Variovorax sp. NFACC26]SFG76806.1 hypothetical protein SAMN03159447_04817 [Variovorax sp. NFACC27]